MSRTIMRTIVISLFTLLVMQLNAQEVEIGVESTRRDETTSEQIDASKADTINKDCMATADCSLKDAQTLEVAKESTRRDSVTTEQVTASQADTTNKTCMATADCGLKDAQTAEVSLESARRDNVTTEQITASTADTTNKTCVATADCGVKDAQKAKVDYETSDVLPTQKDLVLRQTEGFDDNLRTKLFDTQMSSWAMMFSSGLINQVPCVVTGDGATDTYNGIITGTMPAEIASGNCTPTPAP